MSPDLEWLHVGLVVVRSLLMLLLESKPSLLVSTCAMIQWRDWQFVLAELLRAHSHQHTLKSVASCYCVMASHTSADVTRFVVCNYYVASHKNDACMRETLHVRLQL